MYTISKVIININDMIKNQNNILNNEYVFNKYKYGLINFFTRDINKTEIYNPDENKFINDIVNIIRNLQFKTDIDIENNIKILSVLDNNLSMKTIQNFNMVNDLFTNITLIDIAKITNNTIKYYYYYLIFLPIYYEIKDNIYNVLSTEDREKLKNLIYEKFQFKIIINYHDEYFNYENFINANINNLELLNDFNLFIIPLYKRIFNEIDSLR